MPQPCPFSTNWHPRVTKLYPSFSHKAIMIKFFVKHLSFVSWQKCIESKSERGESGWMSDLRQLPTRPRSRRGPDWSEAVDFWADFQDRSTPESWLRLLAPISNILFTIVSTCSKFPKLGGWSVRLKVWPNNIFDVSSEKLLMSTWTPLLLGPK